jgi:hypothetical protein
VQIILLCYPYTVRAINSQLKEEVCEKDLKGLGNGMICADNSIVFRLYTAINSQLKGDIQKKDFKGLGNEDEMGR